MWGCYSFTQGLSFVKKRMWVGHIGGGARPCPPSQEPKEAKDKHLGDLGRREGSRGLAYPLDPRSPLPERETHLDSFKGGRRPLSRCPWNKRMLSEGKGVCTSGQRPGRCESHSLRPLTQVCRPSHRRQSRCDLRALISSLRSDKLSAA